MYNKNKSSALMLTLIFMIGLAAYNVALFAIAGFEDHTGTFWTSYVFTMVAFIAVAVSVWSTRYQNITMRDWLFGYPVIMHCTVYLTVQVVLSVVFMLFQDDIAWGIAFAVQFLVLAVFAVMVLSCFMSKQAIEGVDNKIRQSTVFIKMLRTDAELAAAQASDPVVRATFNDLAEQARYSDPVSNPALADLERQIAVQLAEAKNYLTNGNDVAAHECGKKAALLLKERNMKCKALK